VKYLLMLLVGMLVACPEKPKATSAPTDSDANVRPSVQFVNPPPKKSDKTSVTVQVRASNNATVEYAYAFINGAGDCNTRSYNTWRDFSQHITITPTQLGDSGIKTLCAKGRKADNTEQSNPISHEWERVEKSASSSVEEPDDDGGAPSESDPGENPDDGGDASSDGDGGDTTAEDEGQSLATDDVKASTEKLELSRGVVKFFSAQKGEETLNITNKDSMDSLTYSLTTEDTAGLLQVRAGDDDWETVKKKGTAIITGPLPAGETQHLQLRLAHQWKTDYGDDQQIEIKFSDGSDSVMLTVHILAPELQITADDSAITSSADKHVWEVNLTPSDNIKTLTVSNKRGDLDVLKWDVFPYRWKPNWFDYGVDTGKLTVKLRGDCNLYPTADADDELTLIIASNSDSAGVEASSFALFHYQQEIQWQAEEETALTTQKTGTKWRTNDIRYVVVKFKNEEGATCP